MEIQALAWNTLDEAAANLANMTGGAWDCRGVLDAALRLPENPHIQGGPPNRKTAIEAALPPGHALQACVLNVGEGRREIENMPLLSQDAKQRYRVAVHQVPVRPVVLLQSEVLQILQAGQLTLNIARERDEEVFSDGTPRYLVAIEPPVSIALSALGITFRELSNLAERVCAEAKAKALKAERANLENPQATPEVAQDAKPLVTPGGNADNKKTNSKGQWWETKHDIMEMAQNIGARLKDNNKSASNTAISKEIETAINGIERNKATGRIAPRWDTIRGRLTGWKWKPE